MATDTLFSSSPSIGGITCAQLYVGKDSMFTAVFGMTRESQFSTTLEEYIRKWGAMSALKSDNGKSGIFQNGKTDPTEVCHQILLQ